MGRFFDKFSCRCLIMIGVLLFVIGFIVILFVNNIAIMFIIYSIFIGLGVCFCRILCFLIVVKYFNKKRLFVIGILIMGVSFGMFVWGFII